MLELRADMEVERAKLQQNAQLKREEMMIDAEIEREKMALDAQMKAALSTPEVVATQEAVEPPAPVAAKRKQIQIVRDQNGLIAGAEVLEVPEMEEI